MSEIVGVGVDLCEIARIEKAIARPGFLERWYTDGEREVIASRGKGAAQTAAAMFAAKEAVAKALHTGFAAGVLPQDIAVTYDALGAPGVALTGGAKERFHTLGGTRIHLSLTHEDGMAAAFAVAEGDHIRRP